LTPPNHPGEPRKSPPPRRRFFSAGLRALLDGIDEAARSMRNALPALRTDRFPVPHAAATPLLRPPGAQEEATFASTCERSGACVSACPVHAIQILRSGDPTRDGTPYLVPSQRACVVCDSLACMKACPSGALTLVPKHAIRIGLAVVDHAQCRRSFGEPCRECIDRCPLGADAIGLDDRGRVAVKEPGCVGCGVCEQYCPTTPRAITIIPVSAR
jgi:ferredoxin-type protein NapG